ncbi:cellulose binding domain-containing protein [Actinoplanes sp. NEAU-A12]|uniref:Cellulose binding domain-containing protein n=1 Tax=Actinoplanes sandaracinus TaxID=3045177 RepID=A0ABT6WUN8_9ACTN|nr:cellulose binding domain-containing protein [Actinoplanes sandaracinus]MDI6103356.1 cellulose binding domain-containing protein [Actinoplanes sandaracinus]
MPRQGFRFGPIVVATLVALSAAGMAVSAGMSGTASAADVAAAAPTSGCGKTPTLRSGTHTMQSNGKSRSFILRIPGNYQNTNPHRLIFAFHWRGGTAGEIDSGGTSGAAWSYYGQAEQSNNTAILVAPQGLGNGWGNSGGEDVTFVDDMIRRIEADLCVDTTQRFATGFSWGGGMSYALACARPTVFRAVAVIAGAQISGCSGGTQPIAYFGLHGISDNVLNIAQGRSLRDTFVRNNGCASQRPPEPAAGSRTHVTTTYAGCRAGYPVQWAAFDNGHMPGPVDGTYAESGVTTWTKKEIWRFFAQFQTTPPSPSPSAPPSSTPPTGDASCSASVSLNSWNGGFVATVRVTAGPGGTNGWTVSMSLPGGAAVTNTWGASASGNSGAVQFSNVAYNGRLSAGQVAEFGFQGTGSGSGMTPACAAT